MGSGCTWIGPGWTGSGPGWTGSGPGFNGSGLGTIGTTGTVFGIGVLSSGPCILAMRADLRGVTAGSG